MTVAQEKFLVVGKPDITQAEESAVLDVLRSGWLGNGPISKTFEQEFSESLSNPYPVSHAIALNSCTTGLALALRAERIGRYDEVITTPLTFAATVNAILEVGAKPVFADVDETGCIDPFQIERKITPLTKAIIPVHLHGSPCQMDWIMEIAMDRGIKVIEDAAHAYGGNYNGVPLGTHGQYGVFSFYPTKNLASGDGGMLLVNDENKTDHIRTLASQGLSADAWMRYGSGPIKNYEVEVPGHKGLMNDLCASIALTQLRRWPEMKEKRNTIFRIYEDAFGKKAIGHSQHIYAIRSNRRETMRQKLHDVGIGTGIHYRSLNQEPAYRYWVGMDKGDFPNAEKFGEETLSLPLSSAMTADDALRVVEEVKKIGEGSK